MVKLSSRLLRKFLSNQPQSCKVSSFFWVLITNEWLLYVRSKANTHIFLFFPQVSDQELNVYMQQLSSAHSGEFDNMSALKELYIYIDKYFSDIMDSLDESPNARKLGLGHKLKSLAMSLYPHQNIC